ncbi:MAG: S8 family serine peptidase [Balneolaceae bacterium]|nr:S8 family serine peptidase [Balneolaceae bacterium]
MIKNYLSFFCFIILVYCVALVTGCNSDFLGSQHEKVDLQQVPSEVFGQITIEDFPDIPRLQMDVPEERPWDTDVTILRDSIAANDGRAMIGIKAPESKRLRETNGIRAALSSQDFRSALQMIDSLNIEIESVYRSFGAVAVQMDPDYVFELYDHPQVDYIEIPLNRKLQSSWIETSALSQVTPWGNDLVRAPIAWSEATGNGVKVLVIDSGMNNHIDLPDRPTSNCGGTLGGGGCSDPTNHGTHVSGVLMALDNEIGVVGVAPGIADVNAYSYGACDAQQICSVQDVIDGIDFGVINGVDVINMSLGGVQSHTGESNAVAAAWNTGIVMVAAAGNVPAITGGTVLYPAGYNEVIGVSGVRDNGYFANTSPCVVNGQTVFSNHGSHVSLSAPFWALSTVGTTNYEDETDGWCGTSFATPHVSGAAALLFDQNPSWSNSQVRHRLQNTANHPFNSLEPDDEYGHGVLDAAAAVGFTLPIHPFIEGPNQIKVNEFVQFDTTVGGGARPYSFQWQIDYNMTGNWQNIGGNAAFYGHQSFNDDDFALRVIVTDTDNDSGTSTIHWVTVTW